MRARQHIYRWDGSRLVVDTRAHLHLKYIPGQGPYWKWLDAARFELWSLDAGGHRAARAHRAQGRLLPARSEHTDPGPRSPRTRVFPTCNQDGRKRHVTLGTSVGWSDVYPPTTTSSGST